MRSDLNNWQLLSIESLKQIMHDADYDWYLAGGIALDEFLGRRTRDHEDMDILVNFKYLERILDYFKNYKVYTARNGSLSLYALNNIKSTDSLWITKDENESFIIEILFFEEEAGHWIYKRNDAVRKKIEDIYFVKNDMKIIQPEIQLLYKMNSSNIREKDLDDYHNIYPVLEEREKAWLDSVLKFDKLDRK
ncbi:hypothetical protein KYI13_08425 [Macrococcoides bohemicum]|uniref:nucleotidyltransferase domain-containing protein n=1 Tax=Macrococcoides bohemicum TaxID=1903056 RepID=UPI001C5E6C2E|nr:hypothetical protein [Macrococcus bohemicus]QYA44094.1 hypothetical protein KYI13_08425 [Macrococcus bohemicus]